jgi:hypothetical protein
MRRIFALFSRIFNDILSGRNIDAYAVTIIGVAILILDVIGDVPQNVQLSVIIAALAVLVFRSTAPATRGADLDEILLDRKAYGPFRDFLKGGKTLWVCAPSAVNIFNDPTPVKEEILDRGGEVTVLMQDPNADPMIIENLQKQLDRTNADELINDVNRVSRILTTLKGKGNVNYGYIPNIPGFTLTIIDPEKNSGRLVVEFLGYSNEFIGQRMHIVIKRTESEYWFDYWVEQFKSMHASARQPSNGA